MPPRTSRKQTAPVAGKRSKPAPGKSRPLRPKPQAAAGPRPLIKSELRKVYMSGNGDLQACSNNINALLHDRACATLGVSPNKLPAKVGVIKKCPEDLSPEAAFEWLYKRSAALRALEAPAPPLDKLYAKDAPFLQMPLDAQRDMNEGRRGPAINFAPWIAMLYGTVTRNHYRKQYDAIHGNGAFPHQFFCTTANRAANSCVKACGRHCNL